ncbi:MAG: M48 family metallopeptidase [Burkholderiales bacterium]|nr:M48 family metallopeptidase [Opitutaceae bacterium]
MDFFEAQARAKKRSGRLVVLFALAVAGTIAATYGAALLITRLATGEPVAPWRPDLLGGVAAFTLIVCGIASLVRWTQLRAGGPAVAEHVGGRRIHSETTDLRERTLLNVVEEMALASGLPVPAVYILPGEAAINAFAAGYSPADAAVAVSEGALARLNRDELQGVIAHEFSHILNGDMRINTRLSALVFGILALSVVGRVILRSLRHVRGSRRGGKDNGGGFVVVLLAAGVALLVIGYIGHLFGKLIQAAVSRQREFLADASAVQFTRNPAGIGDALKKLGGTVLEGRLEDPRAGEISHFCFAQNFSSSFGALFATHPPLEERIRAIDPAFDGKFLASTPLSAPAYSAANLTSSAGFGGLPPPAPFSALRQVPVARIEAADLIGSAGSFSNASVQAARTFIATVPDSLRDAVHDPARAAALCYAVCLPRGLDPAALAPLLGLVAERADATAARHTAELHAEIEILPASHRLPLIQLATPNLRQLDPAACATVLDTLDALIHADGVVTPHEFALHKILSRTLGLAARPRDALHVLAPTQVAAELSLALSAAARIEAADATAAAQAFARAAIEFNGLQPPLAYQPAGPLTFDHLDAALDRLALTPAPFRKRILSALATALTADSRLTETEAELLRAIAAALDCPLPPVLPVSA